MTIFSRLARCACLALFYFLWCATPVAASEHGLAVTLRLPVTKVRHDGTLPVEVVLSNRSDKKRMVLRGKPGFNEAGGVDLVVIDAAGTRRRPEPAFSELTLEEAKKGDKRTLLPPQTSVLLQRRIRIADVAPSPGRYELVVTYASPVPSADNRSVNAADVEGSRGTSQSVVIEVTP